MWTRAGMITPVQASILVIGVEGAIDASQRRFREPDLTAQIDPWGTSLGRGRHVEFAADVEEMAVRCARQSSAAT